MPVHRDVARCAAWESAARPDLWHPVTALIDVVTRAETPEEGRRLLRQFADMYVETITRDLQHVARKLKEERDV